MSLLPVTLDDKYALTEGPIHIAGAQAIVRLAMMQYLRDKHDGRNTASYISGYRGSPMHNIDKELWRAKRFLPDAHIHFHPGVNEDLAATAIWGTQQANAFDDCRYDGVFSIWYGKGPGIDRSLDAIRHGHLAGSSRHGGVLIMVGDDHALTSTDVPAAHEYVFAELMMPMLYPANVQELIEYGLLGFAMSRFSGAWVGYKVVPDTVDASARIDSNPFGLNIVSPNDVEIPADGLNIRIPDVWTAQEPRLRRYRLPAALSFARANQINRVTHSATRPRYGIIASGKAWTDVCQALVDLGLSRAKADELGITVLKMGMIYPFDNQTIRDFCDGLEEVLVVEEKHRFIETHARDALYELSDGRRPRVIGQKDTEGRPLLPDFPELNPDVIALAIAARIKPFHDSDVIRTRVAQLTAKRDALAARTALSVVRSPYFCSGCPHNSSTRVPEGSKALGGVGCHFMATMMERDNVTHTHMGGEGANWVGQAPFVETKHVFQNMGDGTYYHSGLMAIRAAIAAKVNITYKILFNDAVAMTGGQPVDGPLSPQMITHQVRAEGVERIHVVSDEPEKYREQAAFATGTRIAHRRELDSVQRECREYEGVSVLVYDQTCAAEKRRRRKRGDMIDPLRRVFINDRVCEGCGDCNSKSNCMSVLPLDTAYGRKRRIDQSACNKDFSCAEGFCPSFVSVVGASPKKFAGRIEVPPKLVALPEPDRPDLSGEQVFSLMVAGVGGTGVVTIGALLTMAAHMDGLAFSTVDQFGMAQKGGAVTSHIRIARQPSAIGAVRLNAASADLVLGCDSLVTAGDLALNVMSKTKTTVIVDTHEQITGQFTRHPDMVFPSNDIGARIRAIAGDENTVLIDATKIALGLLGDAIGSNLFMLGYAYQLGCIPVSARAIEQAIELNGVAVQMNQQAFVWGRRAARDLGAVEALLINGQSEDETASQLSDLEAYIDARSQELRTYQSCRYARRYSQLVEEIRSAVRAKGIDGESLAFAVAKYAFKLMAYKDEYEVARLYADGAFERKLEQNFDGDYKLQFHLAPPMLAKKDPVTGNPRKMTFGAWMLPVFKVLSRLRFLRGTPFDFFGYTEERRHERALVEQYFETITSLLNVLNRDNYENVLEIASFPEQIRGYGHIKEANRLRVLADLDKKLAQLGDTKRPDVAQSAA